MDGYDAKKSLYISMFVLLCMGAVVLGFLAREYRRDLRVATDINEQIVGLLESENGVEGKSCAILTQEKAQGFLGAEVVKNIGSRQFVGGTQASKPGNSQLYWSDSCQFEDALTSNRYVELYISTYKTKDQARAAYRQVLPQVNEAVTLDAAGLGDELMYDAGVMYLLRDRELIRVAASSGSTFMAQEFTRSVFDAVIPQI